MQPIALARPVVKGLHIIDARGRADEQLEDVLVEYVANRAAAGRKSSIALVAVNVGVQLHPTPELAQGAPTQPSGRGRPAAHQCLTIGSSSSPRLPIGEIANWELINSKRSDALGKPVSGRGNLTDVLRMLSITRTSSANLMVSRFSATARRKRSAPTPVVRTVRATVSAPRRSTSWSASMHPHCADGDDIGHSGRN